MSRTWRNRLNNLAEVRDLGFCLTIRETVDLQRGHLRDIRVLAGIVPGVVAEDRDWDQEPVDPPLESGSQTAAMIHAVVGN